MAPEVPVPSFIAALDLFRQDLQALLTTRLRPVDSAASLRVRHFDPPRLSRVDPVWVAMGPENWPVRFPPRRRCR